VSLSVSGHRRLCTKALGTSIGVLEPTPAAHVVDQNRLETLAALDICNQPRQRLTSCKPQSAAAFVGMRPNDLNPASLGILSTYAHTAQHCKYDRLPALALELVRRQVYAIDERARSADATGTLLASGSRRLSPIERRGQSYSGAAANIPAINKMNPRANERSSG
jgi:hypothetical protein